MSGLWRIIRNGKGDTMSNKKVLAEIHECLDSISKTLRKMERSGRSLVKKRKPSMELPEPFLVKTERVDAIQEMEQ